MDVGKTKNMAGKRYSIASGVVATDPVSDVKVTFNVPAYGIEVWTQQ